MAWIAFVFQVAVNPSMEAADKTSLFCTPWKANIDPLMVRAVGIAPVIAPKVACPKRRAPKGP